MKHLFIIAVFLAFTGSSAMAENDKNKNKNKEFKECVAVELYTVSPKFANKGKQPEDTTKIPDGWTLVGGAGGGGHPTMMICR